MTQHTQPLLTTGIQRARIQLDPWCDLECPDSRVIFRTAARRWLFFHTTTCEAADQILPRGFQNHTCRIGFQQRASNTRSTSVASLRFR